MHPLDCGTLTAPQESFEQGGGDDSITVPVTSWLIRHPDGLVVFDAGMPFDLAEPSEFADLVGLFFGVDLDRERLVGHRLESLDVDPADVDVLVLSHLHFDHAGGVRDVPNARLIVQFDEWAAGTDPELAALHAMRADDYDLGHDRITPNGEHDIFGDGRIVCIPTPGHTPGHQSLRVRLADQEVVLCGDCAYFERTLDGGALPGLGDHARQRESLDRLLDLRRNGARLIPGHDADLMASLPAEIR